MLKLYFKISMKTIIKFVRNYVMCIVFIIIHDFNYKISQDIKTIIWRIYFIIQLLYGQILRLKNP